MLHNPQVQQEIINHIMHDLIELDGYSHRKY